MNGSVSTNITKPGPSSDSYSAFMSASKEENPIRPPFGAKELRFDG
jgi:hypothetical protein